MLVFDRMKEQRFDSWILRRGTAKDHHPGS